MELQTTILRVFNSMAKFIGRQHELSRLQQISEKPSASLVVIKGRRRIGKSRLVQEFAKSYPFFSFSGVAPTKATTAVSQREEFASQLKLLGFPSLKTDDWNDLFFFLASQTKKGQIVILFDEISWMGSKDPHFLGKLKNAWDLYFSKNAKLILIICGSASSWIEKNILSNTGFVGRISLTLTLRELTLSESRDFWPKNISDYEILKILSVTGGVPKYLEEINPKYSAEENIKNLCFTEGGFLVDEFEKIFSDIFLRDSEHYKNIVRSLSEGHKDLGELQIDLKLETQSRLSEYLNELMLAGFITRDFTWNIKTAQDSKLSHYRLHDAYLRFYLKYIEKERSKIARHTYIFKSLTALPAWQSCLGFQFENLVIHNRAALYQKLHIPLEEISCENPYFQRKTSTQEGCQIDYMIQTKFNTLYVCEIKFSKNPIGTEVIDEVQKKITALNKTKAFSCRPVLIHVNGVTQELIDQGYFSHIIDFSSLLNLPNGRQNQT